MRLLQRASAWFLALEPARRTRLLAALAIALVTAVGLSIWAGQETWSPVLSGRGYDTALQAASAVEAAGIPYKLSGTDTLMVPQQRLGAARAAISAERKLPGLADVGELQLGLTPAAQQWAFLRTAEGDLARMLNGIDGIVASQVHVVPRQDSLYLGEERPGSASVFVQLEPGAELQSAQVRAIVNLVANAVDGLQPSRVSVADDRGNLLATGTGEDDGPLHEMRSLTDYRGQLEARYERAVSQALLPVLGYGGGFSVTATVDLDLTSRETTTRKVDAEQQAIISEVNEETQTQSGKNGGVPGVDANLPERAAPASGNGNATNRTALTTNYVYPTVDEVAKRPAGGVQRLSVAVQVDENRIVQLAEASGGKIAPDALKRQIDQAVSAAVGFDAARKDVVAVTYLPFAAPVWTVGTEPERTPASVAHDGLPYLVPLVALLLVFWFVVRPMVTASLRPIAPPEPEVVQAEAVTLERGADQDEDLAMRLKALVDAYQPVDHGDLNRLVDREAEAAADVLRKWARARQDRGSVMASQEEGVIRTLDDLSGPQRAAILLMVLDRSSARKVLEHMTVREVEEMGRAVAEIDNVEPEVVEQLVGAFVRDLARSSVLPKTGREFALDVLPELVGGDKGERVGGTLRRAFSTEFQDFCAGHPPRTLAALLRDEHPQTQAVALLMMGAETAARVLSELEEAERFDLSLRMAKIEAIPATIADDIEHALQEALDQHGADRWALQGVDRTAQTLGRLARPTSEPLLDQITDVDPELSELLRRRMVTFADLTVLDDRSIQTVLKQIERQTLLVALRGADGAMRERFLKNMSSRAASDLREEIELLPPMPRSEVSKAQEEIVAVVQKLAAEGLVRLYLGNDEMV